MFENDDELLLFLALALSVFKRPSFLFSYQ